MIFSIIGAVIGSFLLAFAMSYIGIGVSGSVMFGLFLAIILPGILYKYLTVEREETTTSTSGGTTTVAVVKKGPRASTLVAKLAVGSIYAILLVTMLEVILSPIVTRGDVTWVAVAERLRNSKVASAIWITPLDTASLESDLDECQDEAALVHKEYEESLEELKSQRGDGSKSLGYEEYLGRRAHLKQTRDRRIKTIGDRLCPGVDLISNFDGININTTTNPFTSMGVFTALAVIAIAGILLTLVANLLAGKFNLVGRNIGAIIFVIVIAMALNAWWDSTWMSKVNVNPDANPYARSGGIVTRVLTHGGEKTDNCMNAEELSFNNRWVPTGFILEPGDKLEVEVHSSIHLPGMPEATAEGYDTAPVNMQGARMCDADMGCRFLQVIGKADNPYVDVDRIGIIGSRALVEADVIGTGPFVLSVDHVIRKKHHNLKANNEWTLLRGRVCWNIKKI